MILLIYSVHKGKQMYRCGTDIAGNNHTQLMMQNAADVDVRTTLLRCAVQNNGIHITDDDEPLHEFYDRFSDVLKA